MKLTGSQQTASIISKYLPRTKVLALQLLCSEDDHHDNTPQASTPTSSCRGSVFRQTNAAWTEDSSVSESKLNLWYELVRTCAEERELPTRRGLFVGIAGVFYAAKTAGCD